MKERPFLEGAKAQEGGCTTLGAFCMHRKSVRPFLMLLTGKVLRGTDASRTSYVDGMMGNGVRVVA